jgi:hypothetical protein
MAFGQPVNTTYRFDLAQRILSLDCDFLSCLPGSLRYSREFMARRQVTENNKEMNRLYVVETTPSNTGAMRRPHVEVKPSELEGIIAKQSRRCDSAIKTPQTGNSANLAVDRPSFAICNNTRREHRHRRRQPAAASFTRLRTR